MANYRQIHVSIWKDDWFLDLEIGEKLFFVYLFSNELASLAGIYKLPLRVMSFETGIDLLLIQDYLEKFEKSDKVYYRDWIIWVKNLRKYNQGSQKVDIRIQKDIDEIPYCKLKGMYLLYFPQNIPYGYHIDTISYEMKCNEDEVKGNGKKRTTRASAPTTPETPVILETKDPTAQQAMFGALVEVTGIDGDLQRNAGRIGKTASELSKKYTPEFIKVNYSRGGWWYLNDWRGKKGGMPTLEQIVETIGQVALPVPVVNGSNGYHPSTPYERSKAALAEAMKDDTDE